MVPVTYYLFIFKLLYLVISRKDDDTSQLIFTVDFNTDRWNPSRRERTQSPGCGGIKRKVGRGVTPDGRGLRESHT